MYQMSQLRDSNLVPTEMNDKTVLFSKVWHSTL